MFIVAAEIKFTVNSFAIFISHFAHCLKWDGQLPYRRDVRETFRAKAETRLETHVSETETFKILSETRPRRDVAASETLAETLKLPRLSSLGSFNVLPKRFLWRMVKHIDNEKNYTY